MQSDNPILDGLARLMTDAAGAAQSVRTEMDTFMRQRLERLVADMDFVPREEFEAVKAMAAKARSENEKLEARIAALEASLARRPKAIHRRSESCEWAGEPPNRVMGTLVSIQNLVSGRSRGASFCFALPRSVG